MDPFNAHLVQLGAGVGGMGILGSGPVLDLHVFVGRQLGLSWLGVPIFEEDLVNVVFIARWQV